MKFKQIVLPVLLMLAVSFQAKAQTRLRDLRVGEAMPDIEIKSIINSTYSSAKVSNFKGKLLIIDFWATWCSPCIASFPKLDSLQKKFADKMHILLVTDEDSAKASNFLQRLGNVRRTSLASATNDKTLKRLFVHKTIPHYVWLNQDAKVIAITSSDDINADNINAAINGEKFAYKLKNEGQDRVLTYDYLSILPVINVQNGATITPKKLPNSTVLIHSVLTNYIEGIGQNARLSSPLHLGNASISWLYRFALSGNSSNGLNNGLLKIEIPDSALYKKIFPEGLKGMAAREWMRDNTYCYELTIPPSMESRRFSIMLEDLNRYFGPMYNIEGVYETRMQKCLALTRITEQDLLASKGSARTSKSDALSLTLKNSYMPDLILMLSKPLQQQPVVIDQTNYKGKIDIELNCPLSNLAALNKELQKFGLQLQEKEIMMNVPVIRMKKGEGEL